MKRTDLSKLSLKKTTIRVLDSAQLGEVAGGYKNTNETNCSTSCTTTTATICRSARNTDGSWCCDPY